MFRQRKRPEITLISIYYNTLLHRQNMIGISKITCAAFVEFCGSDVEKKLRFVTITPNI